MDGLMNNIEEYFIPYVIQIEVQPTRANGRRRDAEIWIEKYKTNLLNALLADDYFKNNGLVREISYTPQFGQTPHRINLVGSIRKNYFEDTFRNTIKQTTDTNRINDGNLVGESVHIVTGNVSGSVAQGQSVTSEWADLASELIGNLVTVTSGLTYPILRTDIIRVRVGAVDFGRYFQVLNEV
jgi:hypothetical protein